MYYYRLISSMLKAVISTLSTGLYAVYKGESNALASLTTSLYAVYKAESNANDSLTTYNGTAQGGLTYSAGKSGNAFVGNGSNAYVSLPNNSLNFTGDYSVSCWVYITTTVKQHILTNYYWAGGASNQYGWWLTHSSGNIQFSYINSLQQQQNVLLAYSGKYDGWHHIVGTKKLGGSMNLYIDGVLVDTNTNTTNVIYTTTHYPCICAMKYNATQFEGFLANNSKIDEVNVWNKELTATEITELYNSGNGKFYQGNAFYSTVVNDSLAIYNGTAQGGLTYTAGKSGNAFTFNGTNAYVSLPTNSFKFNSDFSICLWSKLGGNVIDVQTLFANYTYDGTYRYGYLVEYYNNALRFQIYNNSGVFELNYTTGSLFGNWKNVVITRKYSTGTKMYIDGVLVASNTSTQNPNYHATMTPAIGAENYGPTFSNFVGYYIRNGGLIDEMNTWTKELTSTEVTELYNAGTGKFYPTF